MQIKPEKYSSVKRAPVWGEECVPQLNPAKLYRLLFADATNSFLFESGKGPSVTARYSMMGESSSKLIRISRNNTPDPLLELEQINFDGNGVSVECPPHFWGGWVGYVGYDAAWLFEKLPERKKEVLNIPDICFMLVDRLAVYDHETGILRYIVSSETADYDLRVEEIRNVWERIHSADLQTTTEPLHGRPVASLKSDTTKTGYMAMVEKAKRYISDGDIYQANIAQRFETDFTGDPFELYLRLRSINPSPFAGFLKFDDLALVSSSPERLIKLEDNRLETRPIAGTRPRGKTADEDSQLARELLLNEKEKAEHLMLVDLERNDMGRICEFGSVRVSELMFVEKYSHVSHIVSNILGTTVPGITLLDILRAVFPGGTITGCPKIRCMEIIDELEPSCRGPYSGSFGYIGWSRCMDLNIIIRTIIIKDRKAFFHVGAGIVADSDPEKEYDETLAKAAALMEVLGSC